MPVYEYYCPSCRDTFELLRPMKRSTEQVSCPSGHEGATRTISVFASIRSDAASDVTLPSSGGCACGGACACS